MTSQLATAITVKNAVPFSVKTAQQIHRVTSVSACLPSISSGDCVLVLIEGPELIVLERIEPLAIHQAKHSFTNDEKQQRNLNLQNISLKLSEDEGININDSTFNLDQNGQLMMDSNHLYFCSKKKHFQLSAREMHILTTDGD